MKIWYQSFGLELPPAARKGGGAAGNLDGKDDAMRWTGEC